MDIREVSVGYSRRVSDGNFGSEEANAHLTVTLKPGQEAKDVLADLASQATDFVYARLAGSRTRAVRDAVSRLTEQERRWDAYQTARMDAERDAQRYVSKPDAPDVDEEDDPDQGGL